MLQWTNRCEFSDPRERIYPILSTIRSSESMIGLKPDYSQTARQVFQHVILRNLTKMGRLNFLACCEMRGVLGEGPTWVPDFSAPKDSIQLVNLKSCWMSKAQAEYAGGGILKVTGLCSALISSVEKILSGAPVPRSVKVVMEASRAMRRLAASRIECRHYVSGADMLEALCRTFCANSFAEGSVPADTKLPGFEQSRAENTY